MYPFYIFIYIHIHTQSRVLYAYLETQRCRDLGSGLNISKTFFIGYFSLPRSAVILYFTTCYTEKYFQIQFFCGMVKIHLLFFIKMSFDCCALGKKNHKGTKNRTQIQDCCLRTRNPRFWAMVGVDLVAFVKSP